MGGGGVSTKSTLLDSQKRLINTIQDLILNKDANGAKKGMGYGLLNQQAPAYPGPLMGKLVPGMERLAGVATQQSPFANYNQAMQAINPALSGQKAYNFQNLNPGATLQLPSLGATGGLATQSSTYNYNPAQVKSDLDNSKFTQDYFNQSVKNPLMATYNQDIAPKITDAAASTGSTFSTRTQFAKQQALQNLDTQMSSQLANAARQDAIEKSQQDLASQQFNVNSGMQNAQFGAQQNQDYAKLNSINSQFLDSLNTQRAVQAQQVNNQNKQFYDQLNTNTNVGLGTDALNRQMQAAMQSIQIGQSPYQNALMGQNLLNPLQSYNNQNAAAQYQDWQRRLPQNSPYLQLALGTAGLNPNSIAMQQPSPLQYGLQGLAGVGLASSALGGLGSVFGGSAAGAGAGAAADAATMGLGGAAAGGGLLGGLGSAAGGLASGAGDALWGLLGLLL